MGLGVVVDVGAEVGGGESGTKGSVGAAAAGSGGGSEKQAWWVGVGRCVP